MKPTLPNNPNTAKTTDPIWDSRNSDEPGDSMKPTIKNTEARYWPHIKQPVMDAIESERAYQERKWPNHCHTTGEWILIMQKCLHDAHIAWVTGHGNDAALHEIRQVVAVGVAAMEQCGSPPRIH